MELQDSLASLTYPPITLEILKKYAIASGDYNPIHQDEGIAKAMGLPGVIAHGMLTAAYLAECARVFIEANNRKPVGLKWRIASFQTRFKSMTLLGDIITVSGTIKELDELKLVLSLQARNQRGEITSTGIARYIQNI